MATQITPPLLEDIFNQFGLQYQQAYDKAPMFWDKMATRIPSSSRENTYGFIAQIPRMREWLGSRVINNLRAHAFTITNRDFELTIGVDRNDIEDDNLGVYSIHVQEMGRQAAKKPDDLVKEILQANPVGFDGVTFFSDAHPEAPGQAGSATYDNDFAATPLTAANYGTVREAIMTYNADDGEPLGLMPDLLVVPPQLETEARTILNAEFIADPGGVAAGVTNIFRNSAELLVVPELANEGTRWYLMVTNRAIKPLVFQDRKAPQMVRRDSPDDPHVFSNKEFLFGVDSRCNVGVTLPFLAARATA